MSQLFQLKEVFLERDYKSRDAAGNLTPVKLRIGKPMPKPVPDEIYAGWICLRQIVGLGDERVRRGYGVDGIQALIVTLKLADMELKVFSKRENKTISWQNDADLELSTASYAHPTEEIRYATVVEQFIETVPELLPLYEEELQSFGQIIDYPFFGSGLVEFMVEQVRAAQSDGPEREQSRDVLTRIMDFIERGSNSSDEDVVTLMVTGFMEALYVAGDDEPTIVALMGPKSKILYSHLS